MMKENLLITGASSGVGYMLSAKLCKEYNVITISRRIDDLKKNLPSLYSYECDLSDLKSVDEVVKQIKDEHGGVFYIINCAGVMDVGEVSLELIENINYSINVNAIAPMKIVSLFLPEMKEKNKGRIINLTSGAPLNCFSCYGSYSASKSLLNSLTVTLSRELDLTDISVNLMSPGPVRSEMSPNATLEPDICFPTVKYLLDGNAKNQHGFFYWLGHKVPLFPDLIGIKWLEGDANGKAEKIL